MEIKRIFVACPIGSDDSPERLRSDRLLKHIIYPVVKELLGGESSDVVVRADTLSEPGRITVQILRELTTSDVVIADLTGTNPNVMYEVGIRQALVRPLVLMAEKGQHLPFDLNDLRTVFYKLDLDEVETAKAELNSHLEKAMSGSISSLDQALFSTARTSDNPGEGAQSGQNMLAVLEVCENILRETQVTKDLVVTVGSIALELRETKEAQAKAEQEKHAQELGLRMMSEFLQHPEGVEKIIPAMKALIEFNQPQENIEKTPSNLNRAARRRQQRLDKKP